MFAIPQDSWQRPYQYRFPGSNNPAGFELFSLGTDGVESADDVRLESAK